MKELDYIFNPASIAIVGASSEVDSATNTIFVEPLLDFGFKGPIYPINPKAERVMGLKAYPSLESVPGPVDYVICAVAAPLIPGIVQQCIDKKVKALHIFTAGFSEIGTEEGKKLEREIAEKARSGGVRIIGPNCFGISHPRSGLCSMPDMSKEPGPVAVVSQSAATARDLIEGGTRRGLKFSKVINYGNGCDLNETDFLDYLKDDPETEIIAVYLEGVRGRGFFPTLRETARRKPVVLLRGGKTEAGGQAARSHSGSLTTRQDVWEAVIRQAGVIPADDLDELEDILVTLYHAPRLEGKRVGLINFGGGFCVQAADEFEKAGLEVPALSSETISRLREFIPPVGTSVRNPLDVPPGVIWRASRLHRTISILAESPEIDFILVRMFIPASSHRKFPYLFEEQLEGVLRSNKLAKPLGVVFRFTGTLESAEMAVKLLAACSEAGILVYPSMGRAARAFSRVIAYNEKRRQECP